MSGESEGQPAGRRTGLEIKMWERKKRAVVAMVKNTMASKGAVPFEIILTQRLGPANE